MGFIRILVSSWGFLEWEILCSAVQQEAILSCALWVPLVSAAAVISINWFRVRFVCPLILSLLWNMKWWFILSAMGSRNLSAQSEFVEVSDGAGWLNTPSVCVCGDTDGIKSTVQESLVGWPKNEAGMKPLGFLLMCSDCQHVKYKII